ncbi:nucleotide-binding protein [Fervidobacterium sp.]
MIKIAIYGKGGIGKSTICSNLSAAFSVLGFKVMQIGCDPKADSTKNLTGGEKISTVLDQIRSKGRKLAVSDVVFEGFNGVLCVETGGPQPGLGCAGRGIITAFEKLNELAAFDCYKPDVVIYDVLGDVVCGGFAMPLRTGYANSVYIVTSGEEMSLYAAANIASAIRLTQGKGYAKLKGFILNGKNIENEYEIVKRLADSIKTDLIFHILRDNLVQLAERDGQTVIQAFPNSKLSKYFFELAEIIYKLEISFNAKTEKSVVSQVESKTISRF